jgi:hypothetical protein
MLEPLAALAFPPLFIGTGVALFISPLAGARVAWIVLAAELAGIAVLIVRHA